LNTLEIIMHDNFKELLDVRKSLNSKFFGIVEEGQREDNKKTSGQPKNLSQTLQNGAENNPDQNIFNPQNLDEREKNILQQSQEVVPPNKIKEKFVIKILRQKIKPQNFSLRIIEIKGLEFIIEATQQLPKEEKIKSQLIGLIFRKCLFINSSNFTEIESACRLVEKFLQI
ncbi:33508_t:CDS:2, partial [Racocetra persica]